MLSVKSITFDDEEIGQAIVPVSMSAVRGSDDPLFLDRLRAGDAAAFEVLVDRYSNDVYSLLFRLTQNSEEAEDLTQETFLRALPAIKGFRGNSELKTWLTRIAINESRNRFRWWKRRRRDAIVSLDAALGNSDATFADVIADGAINPEEAALHGERQIALQKALLEIPAVYREAIVLCDIEGFTYEETAVAVGCNIGTVKSRISRGRDELRRKLKDL